MKKILSLVLALTITAGIFASCKNDDSASNDSKSNSSLTSEQKNPNKVNTEDVDNYFLVEKIDMSQKQKDSFDAKIFNNNCELPITKENYDDYFKGENGETLDQLLNNARDISAKSIDAENAIHGLKTMSDSYSTYILYLNNFSNNKISAKSCMNNNWWYLYFDPINLILNNNNNEYSDKNIVSEKYYLDMIDQLGTPTEIVPDYLSKNELSKLKYSESKNHDNSETTRSTYYNLVYKYKDFVITIYVTETVYGKDNRSIKLDHLRYHPIECWNKMKEYNSDYSGFHATYF